ncbi:MAG: DUF4276 family protein [Egibacteraceae bacterium]
MVEGKGEIEAVPKLVGRIASDMGLSSFSCRTWRESWGTIMNGPGGLEKAVRTAIARHCANGVLIILDADSSCPATKGPQLLVRARIAARDIPIGLVLAKCEFEAWFLATAESLAGCQGLRQPLRSPANSESIPKAKEWLSGKMLRENRRYSPSRDQAKLVEAMNFGLAERRSPSFAKCKREIERLLKEMAESPL